MRLVASAVLAAIVVGGAIGCTPAYTGPQWTYYTDEKFAAKPASFAPEIFYSSDILQQERTSGLGDEPSVPLHTSIASVAGRGLTMGDVIAKARELGADGAIVSRIDDVGFLLGGGTVDLGKEVVGATFIRFKAGEP